MNIALKILILGLIFSFLISCSKKKDLGLICYQSFQNDTLKISYGNQVLVDSIITTNESIQVALLMDLHFDLSENQPFYIQLNNKIESVFINKDVCGLFIDNDSLGFKIQLDSTCKPQRFY